MGTLSSELKMVKEYLDKALKSINAKYRTIKLPEEPSMVVSQLPSFIDKIEVMNPDDAVTVDTVLCADCIQVDIPEGLHKQGVVKIQTQEKSVTPSKNSTTIEPDDKYVLTKVTIEGDNNLKPDNIKNGVTIFGVSGNLETEKPTQEKTATPSNNSVIVNPDNGYTLSKVTIEGDSDLKSENIKEGVEIFGVSGSLKNYQQKATTVTATGTSFSVEPESGYLFNKITVAGDNNLTASNIRKGVTVYGVTGNLESDVQLPTQEKTVTPTNSDTTVTPDNGYTLNKITVKGDSDLKAENIKSGVSIFGITGSLESSQDVKTQSKTVTPTKDGVTVTPDSGYLLEKVTISGDSDLIPANIKSGVTIFGVTGSLSTTTVTEPNEYYIIYVPNESGKQVIEQTVTYNQAFSITSEVPTADNKTFVEWSTSPDGSGTVYKTGQYIMNNLASKGDNFILYASWNVDATSGEGDDNTTTGDRVYLYNNGVTSNLVGSWRFVINDSSSSSVICRESNNTLYMYTPVDNSDDFVNIVQIIANKSFDYTQYSKIGICMDYTGISQVNFTNLTTDNYLCIGFSDGDTMGGWRTVLHPSSSETDYTEQVNISNSSYENYPYVTITLFAPRKETTVRIKQIWLEK